MSAPIIIYPGQSKASLYAVSGSVAPPPTPGTVGVGQLLIDAQYKSIWLGVDSSIDPLQAILISDMAAMLAADADTLAAANAYTNSKLIGDSGLPLSTKGYAPNGHTHHASDIVDFEDAVIDVVESSVVNFKKGMIIQYYGESLTEVNDLIGWALCDGTAGTPDLRGKFIVGAGTTDLPLKGTNSPTAGNEVKTTLNGAHNHYSSVDGNFNAPNTDGFTLYTTLTTSMIPSHAHPYHEDIEGGHHHIVKDFGNLVSITYLTSATYGGTSATRKFWVEGSGDLTARQSPVYITVDPQTSSANPQHRHPIAWQAAHQHKLPIDFWKTGMPYYALAYIMKT